MVMYRKLSEINGKPQLWHHFYACLVNSQSIHLKFNYVYCAYG